MQPVRIISQKRQPPYINGVGTTIGIALNLAKRPELPNATKPRISDFVLFVIGLFARDIRCALLRIGRRTDDEHKRTCTQSGPQQDQTVPDQI